MCRICTKREWNGPVYSERAFVVSFWALGNSTMWVECPIFLWKTLTTWYSPCPGWLGGFIALRGETSIAIDLPAIQGKYSPSLFTATGTGTASAGSRGEGSALLGVRQWYATYLYIVQTKIKISQYVNYTHWLACWQDVCSSCQNQTADKKELQHGSRPLQHIYSSS